MFTLPENPYAILSVAKNAQIPEIRLAYRKLVLKCHPDKVTDPAQKAVKAEEFQKVQKAYEILSDESERQKYDDMVRANELEKENAERRKQRDRETTPSRTPTRSYDSDYGRTPQYTVRVPHEATYKTRTPEREPPPFMKSKTWTAGGTPYASTKTPPRSHEDIHFTTVHVEPRESRERESRRSKKAPMYEEKISTTRYEDERRSRKKEDDAAARLFEKAEKARRKEEALQRELREAAEEKDRARKEKERRKEEKKRAEKVRDSERRREADDKRSRHKTVTVEEESDTPLYTTQSKEKKSKSSSRSKETSVPFQEFLEPGDKYDVNKDWARAYLQTASGKHARGPAYSAQLPPVQTPPPANHGVAPPPPMAGMAERMFSEEDEPLQRSAARRRGSNESPRVRGEKVSSSHKKSREPEYMPEPVRQSPPKIHRSQTEYPSAPGGTPGLGRATTWTADQFHGTRRDYFDEEYSEDDARYQRRSRRTRSPENVTFTYKVDSSNRTGPAKVRSVYPEERRSGRSQYPEANMGRPLEHRPAMPSYHSFSGTQSFHKVKQSKAFDPNDVQYSAHIPQAYGREYGMAS
ncbi:hypothetical protein E8E14_006471 [Neopestalotiopsis sp. 37M]|nr:hypothetical protein E8E14_006471 [Neopestalotiopsis sp. 37M]